MLNLLDIIIVLLILSILFIVFHKNQENYKYLNYNINMIRPNCPQLNDYKTCVKTPGCRYLHQSDENIELSVADSVPGVGGQGCINHYEDLQDPVAPMWEKDNFLISKL